MARGGKERARTRRTLNEAPRSAFTKNTPSRADGARCSVRLGNENSRFSFSRTATLNYIYGWQRTHKTIGRQGQKVAPFNQTMSLSFRDLKAGCSYIHKSGNSTRTIDAINGDDIHWHDDFAPGTCTRATFTRQCIAVATPEDLQAIQALRFRLAEKQEQIAANQGKLHRHEKILRECLEARRRGHPYIVIESRDELGFDYDEVMANLALIEEHQIYLRIMKAG